MAEKTPFPALVKETKDRKGKKEVTYIMEVNLCLIHC